MHSVLKHISIYNLMHVHPLNEPMLQHKINWKINTTFPYYGFKHHTGRSPDNVNKHDTTRQINIAVDTKHRSTDLQAILLPTLFLKMHEASLYPRCYIFQKITRQEYCRTEVRTNLFMLNIVAACYPVLAGWHYESDRPALWIRPGGRMSGGEFGYKEQFNHHLIVSA